MVPMPVVTKATKPTKSGVIYFGSTSAAMAESLAALELDGIHLDQLRLRGVPVPRQRRRLRRGARPGVRRRAEPRRADEIVARQRMRHRPITAHLGAALRRHADHRALHRQGNRREGAVVQRHAVAASRVAVMTYLAKPKIHHPSLPRNALGYTHRDYEGTISTLCAGCGHDSISAAIIQAFFELDVGAAPRREAVGHRLLVEDADLFPRQLARLQQRARPHALGADGRGPRQQGPHLPRRLRRRRLGVDRPRAVRARRCAAA